ncbi:unnamed protein product [Rhizophagus irregularis]|nr:unnamed protein product [Rhizophagus irregularis]
MNEFLSEEIPFNDIPHDCFLAIKILTKWNDKIKDIKNSEDSKDSEDSEDVNNNENVNSSDLLSFQFSSDANYTAQSTSENPISECLDCSIK